LTNSIVTY